MLTKDMVEILALNTSFLGSIFSWTLPSKYKYGLVMHPPSEAVERR